VAAMGMPVPPAPQVSEEQAWHGRSGTSLQPVWVNPAMEGKSTERERRRNTKSHTSTYTSSLFGA